MATKKRTSEPRRVDRDEAKRLVEELDTENKLVADRLLKLWEGMQGQVANPRRPFSIQLIRACGGLDCRSEVDGTLLLQKTGCAGDWFAYCMMSLD